MSPSIDHVTAGSKGGDDTPSNVHVVHLGCNLRKHDRPWHECSVMLN
jgi:hypothetical protein